MRGGHCSVVWYRRQIDGMGMVHGGFEKTVFRLCCLTCGGLENRLSQTANAVQVDAQPQVQR